MILLMNRLLRNSSNIRLWWGSAFCTGGVHIYLLWLLSAPFVPVILTEDLPAAVMLMLSSDPEFTPNSQQTPAVGLSQDFSEPEIEQQESQPEEVNDTLTAPEQPDALLIVAKKEPIKADRPQQEAVKPRKPVVEKKQQNPSKPSPPAVASSATLSGESHHVAAAVNSDSMHNRQAKINWRNRLQGHLLDFKRYPPGARKQRRQGSATVRFVVNKDGRVLSAQLINSSGTAILDREALATVQRAQPLPKPPAEMLTHGQVKITLPIDFNIKNGR